MANRDKKNRDFRDNRERFRDDEPYRKKDKYWRRFKRQQQEQEKQEEKRKDKFNDES